MLFGITYTLKDLTLKSGGPDDLQEEYDSPETVDAIAKVLEGMGHQVLKLGDGPSLLTKLQSNPPDFVFNFAEGRGVYRSREAWVPSLLEMLNIPYTASDPLTCAVTLEKDYAKRLVASVGVTVPPGVVIQPGQAIPTSVNLTYPLLVKPAWEGSSKGIRFRCLVEEPSQLASIVEDVRGSYQQPVLIEEFIQGDELTVGLIGNGSDLRVLGIMRVIPKKQRKHFVYSLEVKRNYEEEVEYEVNPPYFSGVSENIEAAAKTAFHALGCRDVARVDFRLRNNIPYFLEINPLPGMNPITSDLVLINRGLGLSYESLIQAVVDAAIARHRTGSVR